MLMTWLGAFLIIAGVVLMARQAIWHGRLSGGRSRSAAAGNTLEPPERAERFSLAENWPGLALVAAGALLLLTVAVQ